MVKVFNSNTQYRTKKFGGSCEKKKIALMKF